MKLLQRIKNFFRVDPLKKEFRKTRKTIKHNAKEMTVYEKILTYPLQYGNLLDKYLEEMSNGDEKLLLLLQNVHRENIKNSFLINKFTSELALKLTVEVWKKLKLRESIGLDIVKSTRFAVNNLRTYLFLNDTTEKVYLDNPTVSLSDINGAKSIGFELEIKNIELKGITDVVPLPLELLQNPSSISLSEIQKELLDSMSDVAVQALETIAISTLKESCLIKNEFNSITADHLDLVFNKIKAESFMKTKIFFLILNEETFKKLPEKLSNSHLVKFEISENVPENEIIVTSSSGQDDRKTINTFLHSTNVHLIVPNEPGDPFSFYIHKRVSTEIFSPRSIALITLK